VVAGSGGCVLGVGEVMPVSGVPFWAKAGTAGAASRPAASAMRVKLFMAFIPDAGTIAGAP
jgi:hypothetical protein